MTQLPGTVRARDAGAGISGPTSPARRLGIVALAVLLAGGPAAAAAAAPTDGQEPAVRGAGGTPVRVETPHAVPLTGACRDRKLARVTLDVPDGGGYEVELGGQDAGGYSIDGNATDDNVAGGTRTISVPSQICGRLRTPGPADLVVDIYLWDAGDGYGETRVETQTSLRNPTQVTLKRIRGDRARGATATLRGQAVRNRWPDPGVAPLRRSKLRVLFRPPGGHWRAVSWARSTKRGTWSTRVTVRRTGDWQVRFGGTPRLMSDRSPTTRIKVR